MKPLPGACRSLPCLKTRSPNAESADVRVLLVLLILGTIAVGWQIRRELALDHKLGGIAGEVAGRSVEVDCPGFLGRLVDIRGNGGSVRFDANGKPSDTTELESSVCSALSDYSDTRKSSDYACVFGTSPCTTRVEKAVYAALVLSHEAQHLRGVRSERDAQCYAIQMVPLVAERLGSPPPEAKAVAAHFLAVQQPRMTQNYQLPEECKDGGELDLHPDSSIWPSG